ncbi:hypothetical protein [Peribacillus alkalitolerans]|uniref:hypothetical protein n=1 Tax=Peribacillus alkalitolerans TaxID=1550385 RepID=UPI0013D38DA1|nr:hypothetical protein [Peribacillus alkalitolerans]
MKVDLSSPQIFFDDITIIRVEDNAGVFIGRNHQFNWKTTISSSNSGFGTVSGNDNQICNNKHFIVREEDLVDLHDKEH